MKDKAAKKGKIKKGGTGIGLAQAFRAIQLHNGTIRFDSEVGVGTTFEIILPAST